ncbi:septum formation protein Maf [Candidatus Velamenicoccus archaeovorus]|uniref:Nucleoside triphosphate pyrophosphatase n=1 Tax=Velamenicoccus archaeovorus TaxID=1930593 RepID=A0A410P5G3_VELA1|nr:Maf and M48 domain-containing protein [Candidatus Velamenicoccus archaeovorus]QAT17321.1 septum formation protein Maf [Candidatus Velamenicoccus archaeovorus]
MLILASKSKARKKLLEALGVKFRVMPARVKEHADAVRHPARTVAANALLKARDAARRVKKGIVVGCDTLVWQDGRAFGKPASLKEARAMLKRLSHRPHVLYTGIAVIDAASGREMTEVEETRIEMEPLSDREIAQYFRKVSPLDKAGGFDVQGLGGSFIRRIRGCYFNVVGLPIARLRVMLKKFGVSLLLVLCGFAVNGCSTEYNLATHKEDTMMYSTEREVAIGDSLAAQVEKNYTVVQDPQMNERLDRVGAKVAQASDRHDLTYRFRIIEDPKDKDLVNAVSLPGGYIYIFKNLMTVADTDDELAAVVAHEVAHIVARHSIKRLQAIWGYNILTILAGATKNAEAAQGVQMAYAFLLSGYSQEDELTADGMGAIYAKRAGYNPQGMIEFLDKLRKRQKKEPPQALSYFKTHPGYGRRIRATKEALGENIDFDDFIDTL